MKAQEKFIRDATLPWADAGKGVTRKILGYDRELMMVRVRFDKGSVGYVHKHPHRQVTYVERGAFEVQIGDEKKILATGDCFFIPPEVEHGVLALDDGCLVDVFAPGREDFVPDSG